MRTVGKFQIPVILSLGLLAIGCAGKAEDVVPPPPPSNGNYKKIDLAAIERHMVFNAGDDGEYCYRIPAIVATKGGALLAFCEVRHDTWQDQKYSDIVVKRSTDNGKVWSQMVYLTSSAGEPWMNPVPVVDRVTGKIFVLANRWVLGDNGSQNRQFMFTSTDDGLTWSQGVEMTNTVTPSGYYAQALGPGHGIQLASGPKSGRLMIPVLLLRTGSSSGSSTRALYSDDSGTTWQLGGASPWASELQYADLGGGKVYLNQRASGIRYRNYSDDSGATWRSEREQDPVLPNPSNGCHASCLGVDDVLFYCGVVGGTQTTNYDERITLKLWRSVNQGASWECSYVIWDKAASYSDMVVLPNGKLGIFAEVADTQGLLRTSTRDSGWIRLDLIVLPATAADTEYWFE